MSTPTNREKLLKTGLTMMHRHGFVAASVRDVVKAAGVPQGSFTNHFASKEEFCLQILGLYHANALQVIERTLRNDALPPLQRLRAYIDAHAELLKGAGAENGCLYGNVTAELNEHSPMVRDNLTKIFAEIREALASCLKAAVKTGDLAKTTKCSEVADFILSSMQGAMLLGRNERNATPLKRFKDILFLKVLR